MQKGNHLKLVSPIKKGVLSKILEWLNKPRYLNLKIPFAKTKAEKLAALQVFYRKKYRNEDLQNPDSINIPYFLRAEQNINAIMRNNEINSEYKKNCKRGLF